MISNISFRYNLNKNEERRGSGSSSIMDNTIPLYSSLSSTSINESPQKYTTEAQQKSPLATMSNQHGNIIIQYIYIILYCF